MTAVLRGSTSHDDAHEQWGPRGQSNEVDQAVEALRAGKTAVLLDDVGHGHGFLVHAAERSDAELVAFMVRYSSGYLRVAVADEDAIRMKLPLMVPDGADPDVEPFTVTVDSAHLGGTGISAFDRAQTIRLLASSNSVPTDFTRPGHVLPVRVRDEESNEFAPYRGVLQLARRAGVAPAAAYAEIVADGDGLDLAHGVEVNIIASRLGLPVVRASRLLAQ
ncbi:3,4-dihydroxy-2-butanone-4-phosphate synthase [Cumulibacter soli]|uniref:3,4-dihydroxy-2-butanone-4-phosphate synthase n=1 Tax=Cumulibacter soli TaxID=2546344 RepID=UPI001068878C|nr:3,4-dihydroxy-2-butanone-4-phosphate synthase [Cumulibacter soli]